MATQGDTFHWLTKINLIRAEYPDGFKVQVFYGLEPIVGENRKVTKVFPENYEGSVFHHLKIIDPTELVSNIGRPIAFDGRKGFGIAILRKERQGVTVMRLPSS